MQSPFFSIIIPVYNTGNYLRECLDSFLNQSFTDWECICVDDGSTDGSAQILDEYQRKDARFRVIHQKNAGASFARNVGLNAAEGKYVCLCDSDDVILENWLKAKAEAAFMYPDVDWIRTRYRDWKGNCDARDASPWPSGHLLLEDTGYWEGDDLQRIGFRKISILGTPWLNTFRRKVFCNTKFREGVIVYEDCLFLYENLKKMHSLVVIDDDSYRYRLRQGSVSHRLIDTRKFVFLFQNLYEIWLECDVDAYWSTYWVRKAFKRYFSMIDSHSWSRGLLLRKEFSKMVKSNFLNLKFIPTFSERVCWRCFLLTGLLQCYNLQRFFLLPRKIYGKIRQYF